MTIGGSGYRSRPTFSSLVDDGWGVLKQTRWVVARPGSDRAGPARVVFLGPDLPSPGWFWELWEGYVVPSLQELAKRPPPGGWGTPDGRLLVEAQFRLALQGTEWSKRLTGFPT